ncbi:LysE/ArgO family amino acid transporter [Chthonobacter albigriseus]|uniref:LysE/ArgO family amino acid transporter n=1 Tax=Chthonobacter albigriseus TaxID=1683161 RepID=UPI0015EF20DF|nr:LysE/ArgO family amino acid transporter [Chthonobacter albigriseus]
MTDLIAPFTTGFALSAALIMAIGAQNLFVLRQGLRREHVGPVVLFCGASDALLITLGVSGVGAFLAGAPQMATALALGGAVFLGCYGLVALRRASTTETVTPMASEGQSLGRALAVTAGFTFFNPHVYLDTVLLMGAAGTAQPLEDRPVFVAGAALASFAWFTLLGFGARHLQPLFNRPSVWRALDFAVGIVMLALAVSLAASAFGSPT